jgi:PAS domain S-box-containing protein
MTSGAAGVPATAGDDAGTADLTADPVRFRQFVVLDLAAAVAGVVTLVATWAWLGASWLWPVAAATATSVGLLVWSLRLYRRGAVDRAVLAVCATFWLMLVVATLVIPSMFPGFALLMVWPVLFALQHVRRSTVLRITIVTAIAAVIALLLATRPNPPEVAQIPDVFLTVCFVLVGLTFVGLSLVTLYGYSGRLGEVVGGLRRANEALQASERSLEAKVVERTAELERLYTTTSRQRLYVETLLRVSPVAIVTADSEARVQSWNAAAERLFGWTSDEAVGRLIDDLVANDQVREEALAISQRLADGGEAQLVTRRSRRDGTLVDVQVQAVPIALDGELVGLLAIYADVSELQQARMAAEQADRAKSAFLATMSHEIRTPMNAIIGMTGLLLDTELDVEQREFAEIARSSAESLLTIINDILDFSKIEAGQLDLERVPFNLRSCLESTLDLAAATLPRSRAIDMAYLLSQDTPEAVVGDVTRLRQILLNLLSNALKFTEKGEVVVMVGSRPLDGGAYELQFAVRDTGIGIAPDRIDRLFRSFSQLDPSTTRKYGGTGLGLAISKRLAELMGGSMEVVSQVGAGTTFRFTVVVEAADAIAVDVRLHREHTEVRGRRLLVVDDNETNRRILVDQTTAWGMRVRATGSPSDAVAWIEAGEPFDVAILDMRMPEMDGVALAQRIRAIPAARKLPLVLCSSLGRRETHAEAVDFAGYLTKPLKPSQLLDTLLEVLVRATPKPVVPARASVYSARPVRGLRVLLAEDSAVNQKLALRLLERMGLRADVAGNGREVLDALSRQRYDVILMDIQMPELDGVEATQQIRQRQLAGEEGPWIIAMTANAMQGDREAYLAAGMDDYVSKPIRPGELADALAKVPTPRAISSQPSEGQELL